MTHRDTRTGHRGSLGGVLGALLGGLALAVLTVAAGAFPAQAHPPSSVQLSFPSPGNVQVHVVHPVNDPAKLYISRILVSVGGRVVADRTYNGQTNPQGLTYTFSLGGAQKGARVRVEVICSIVGSASAEGLVP